MVYAQMQNPYQQAGSAGMYGGYSPQSMASGQYGGTHCA